MTWLDVDSSYVPQFSVALPAGEDVSTIAFVADYSHQCVSSASGNIYYAAIDDVPSIQFELVKLIYAVPFYMCWLTPSPPSLQVRHFNASSGRKRWARFLHQGSSAVLWGANDAVELWECEQRQLLSSTNVDAASSALTTVEVTV